MSKLAKTASRKGWKLNTALCVDLKTILQSDRKMKMGKGYQGVLRRDVECEEFNYDEHYTFIETLPWSMKRNPRLYNGKYISITRRDDGSLRPNFKPMQVGHDFNLERYAFGVYLELYNALKGLGGEI